MNAYERYLFGVIAVEERRFVPSRKRLRPAAGSAAAVIVAGCSPEGHTAHRVPAAGQQRAHRPEKEAYMKRPASISAPPKSQVTRIPASVLKDLSQ